MAKTIQELNLTLRVWNDGDGTFGTLECPDYQSGYHHEDKTWGIHVSSTRHLDVHEVYGEILKMLNQYFPVTEDKC